MATLVFYGLQLLDPKGREIACHFHKILAKHRQMVFLPLGGPLENILVLNGCSMTQSYRGWRGFMISSAHPVFAETASNGGIYSIRGLEGIFGQNCLKTLLSFQVAMVNVQVP